MSGPSSVPEGEALARGVLSGDRRSLARLLTRVENRDAAGIAALKELYPHTGRAATVGITGQPGAGKSTLVAALASELRRRGATVGVIAVDPSSPYTRGALLGDRVRMQGLAGDNGVFIRSMATRGAMGGLAAGTIDAAAVLDAFGMEYVIVETVGAGQDEVDIMKAVQTTVVVEIPGAGDGIQALKAGILEIADVFAVNKADREGADAVAANLRQLLSLALQHADHQPPIVKTVATRHEGVAELLDAILDHRHYLLISGAMIRRDRYRTHFQIRALVHQALWDRVEALAEPLARLVTAVEEREQDPHTAAEELKRLVLEEWDEGRG